jgi:hypothetical protein
MSELYVEGPPSFPEEGPHDAVGNAEKQFDRLACGKRSPEDKGQNVAAASSILR